MTFNTAADNIKNKTLLNDLPTFFDIPGDGTQMLLGQSNYEVHEPALETLGINIITSATQRLGRKVKRVQPATGEQFEDLGVGGKRIGRQTVFSNESSIPADIKIIDAYRQGINVKSMKQFSRGLLPFITINTDKFLRRDYYINHSYEPFNFGQGTLFKNFNLKEFSFWPFNDFPGRFDCVEYIKNGNYIHQFPIITDLKTDMNQFIDPDNTLFEGAVEVFEIRKERANTGIADILTRGIKVTGFGTTSEWSYNKKGSAPIDNKYEKIQTQHDHYDDYQDTLFGKDSTFSKKIGYPSFNTTSSISSDLNSTDEGKGRYFTIPGFISNGKYALSPYSESSETIYSKQVFRLRNFFKDNGINFSGTIASESSVSEIGTRFKSSQAGFILSPKYDIISDRLGTTTGTDSIAFIGLNKT